ncbi:MAG: hypothetical protein R3B96_17140 [Pirellulaceae bacterium]
MTKHCCRHRGREPAFDGGFDFGGWGRRFPAAVSRVALVVRSYLSDSLTAKYADSDRPHLRMTRCPIAPEKLSMVRVVTVVILPPITSMAPRCGICCNERGESSRARSPSACLVSERTGRAVDQIDWIDAHHSLNIDDFRVHAITAAL